MRKLSTLLIILTAATTAQVSAEDAKVDISISSGIRRDTLKWSVAGPHHNPNVISELTYKKMKIVPYTLAIKGGVGNYFLQAEGTYGSIFSGKSIDSDYALNNRCGEFSRSHSKVKGDRVFDANIYAGQKLTLSDATSIDLMVGYAFFNEKIRVKNGVQKNHFGGHGSWKFHGLNTTYRSTFDAPVVGIGARQKLFDRLILRAKYNFLFCLQHRGRGHWNLREKSARHFKQSSKRTKGLGEQFLLGLSYKLTDNLSLDLDGSYTYLRAKGGTTQVRKHKQPFNKATLKSTSGKLGLTYAF